MQHDFTNAPEVREANELVARTEAAITGYKIATSEQYEQSAAVLKKIKAGQQRLEALRTGITGPLNAALKAVNDLFRAPTDRLAGAERAIKVEIGRYADDQERIRREEQRKADEAARIEREKAERAAAVARAKADEEAAALRRQAEEAAAAGRAAEAAKLEAKAGQKIKCAEDKAQALEVQAATTVAPMIHREPPKVTGISTREVWKAEVVDLMALVRAIAEGKAPLSLVQENDKVIGQQARSLQRDFVAPGVRVWSERQIAAGTA